MLNANGDFAGDIIVRHARQAGQIRWEYGTLEPEAPAPATKQAPTLGIKDSDSRNAKGSPSRFNH
jgi:hypothetical protein